MKDVMMGNYVKGEEFIDFNFATDLSIADKLRFVNSVVDLLVDDKHYNSVLRDLIFDFYVVDIMTDVDTTELKQSPCFVNDIEKFLEETNIVDIVKANTLPTLLDELNNAVDKTIEYLTGIHPSPLNEALASLVNTLEKKINGFDMDSMMGMAQKFVGMTDELTPESVVNAYIGSDLHKKNLEEIAESKAEKAEVDEVVAEVEVVGE